VTTPHAYALANRIVGACWLIFGVFWLVAAFTTKKTVYRQSLAQRAAWQTMVIAGAVVFFNASREPYPLNALFLPRSVTAALVATALCVCGLAFAIWARAVIGKNWSGRITLKENHELIQRGPYGLVRHPIYTGILTMAAGSGLLIGRVGAVVGWILFLVSFWIKAGHEEALMLQQFPAEYSAYRQRTKRVLPFIF